VVDERRAYDTSRNNHSPDEALAALAARQHGVVSRTQLLELGVTKDAIRRRVERKRCCAFTLACTPSGTWG
jgi:hypothetical protein